MAKDKDQIKEERKYTNNYLLYHKLTIIPSGTDQSVASVCSWQNMLTLGLVSIFP